MNPDPYAPVPPPIAPPDGLSALIRQMRAQISRVILGQETVIEQVIAALLAGGHVLLEGKPGLGKTHLVTTLAKTFGGVSARIQFTPDLMPSDVTGFRLFDMKSQTFQLRQGPVFTNLLLADEINRAPAKTQSALLEVMQELQVTIDGETLKLTPPFMTLATQNPVEHEGTYPLPEAQLDRFLMQIDVGYPDRAAEERMLLATTVGDERQAVTVLDSDTLLQAQALVRRLPVGEKVVSAILGLVRSARPDSDANDTVRNYVAWGPGPRASQA
ncbi:AAA family ATPase, partial [bacterium]|nr:AAA family ATPase [bacterium]